MERKVEIHRNGINAHYDHHTYYALHADSREQITEEYDTYEALARELKEMGYTPKDFIYCY